MALPPFQHIVVRCDWKLRKLEYLLVAIEKIESVMVQVVLVVRREVRGEIIQVWIKY